MGVFECDVARAIPLVPFPLADMCHTLCNAGHDGWLDFDRLGENNNQHQCVGEQSRRNLISIGDRFVPQP